MSGATAARMPGTQAVAAGGSLRSLRRELHVAAEVGLQLPDTQAIILRELAPLELDEVHVGTALSSVTAVLRGARPGPTVVLRSDMDALPLDEQNDLSFAATNGAMHACGHDLHVAGMLGAVRRLAQRREDLAGTVVFAFQPGEEAHGGGELMVGEGVLDAAGVRASECYAIHVWPTVESGRFLTRPGAIMAGLNELRVSIEGVGGHASAPHLLRDTVPVVAEIVMALQSFVARRVDVHDPVVLSVTQMTAESAAINVVPQRSTFAASVRTLSARSVAMLAEELPRLVRGIAEAHGCVADVTFTETYPVTVNTADEVARAVGVLERTFGSERVDMLDRSLMASEDFAFFLRAVPGAFLLLGARPAEVAEDRAHSPHSPRVLFDDGVLDTYATALEALALDVLRPVDVHTRLA